MAGTENQCIAVAEYLGIDFEVKRVGLNQPWKALSPFIGFECPMTFTARLVPPWPDILITSGRKAIAASRYIKKKSQGKTFTLHLQDPRIHPRVFDMVALPKHDPTRGNNVITTLGMPNKVNDDRLDDAREEFAQFENIKKPRVAVLIGGTSKAHILTPAITLMLAEQLNALGVGLMVTASRRTGEENEKILQDILGGGDDRFIWDGTGSNPYFGMLAWADYILVTADSASMLSDAAATGKPVYMIALEGGGKRIDQLHKNLMDAGIIRKFQGRLEHWRYPPLREAKEIADAVKEKLSLVK